MGWYVNFGCIQDPILPQKWCLDFNQGSFIFLAVFLIGFGIYYFGRYQEWW